MTMIGRDIDPANPPHGGCDCDCHARGTQVMHCIPCCTPDRGPFTVSNAPPLFGGLQPEEEPRT
jgi:hypothetical protein